LWHQLGLDEFWQQRLPRAREAVSWEKVLPLLVVNRLLEPANFRVHRPWRKYRCLDRLLAHKEQLFVWLLRPDQHVSRRGDGAQSESAARLQPRWPARLCALVITPDGFSLGL
jgi:hypothetical protein